MNLQDSKTIKGKFIKFSPHKSLNDGWQYVRIQGYDKVLAFRIIVKKTFLVVEKGGQPYLHGGKNKAIEYETGHEVKTLTIDEYEAEINSVFEK